MSDWVDEFAAELGLDELSPQARSQILTLARQVAHHGERKNAPLAAFVAGYAAGARGKAAEDGAAEALASARALLSEAPRDPRGPRDD